MSTIPTLTYIDPLKPLQNNDQHELKVTEVRKWYNKTQFLQASNSITPNRTSFINDLAFTPYQHITGKTYDVKLENHTNKKSPKSYKQAADAEPQWFSVEDKEGDGILEFFTWCRLNQATITPEMRKKALHAHFLYNIKRDGSAKVRVVANGARQHPDTFTDTTSPVASQLQLRIHVAVNRRGWYGFRW
jgi:hypothetical protein